MDVSLGQKLYEKDVGMANKSMKICSKPLVNTKMQIKIKNEIPLHIQYNK